MIITYKKYSTLDKMLLIDMRNLSIKEMIEMILSLKQGTQKDFTKDSVIFYSKTYIHIFTFEGVDNING